MPINFQSLPFVAYCIQNAGGKSYIGITSNIEKRLADHNAGKSLFTKLKGPWSLSWKSKSMTYQEARALEILMKKQKGGVGLQLLLTRYSE